MKETPMQIPKAMIVDLLRAHGKDAEAERAQRTLPAHVDPRRQAAQLSDLGLDPQGVMAVLGGAAVLRG
jgi:hypothetical protein